MPGKGFRIFYQRGPQGRRRLRVNGWTAIVGVSAPTWREMAAVVRLDEGDGKGGEG